uniref:Uncharacterized protein n=1 Tax=Aegilops tauschii TaxID=37682 RepID=M8C1H8_AEGTA
MALPALRALLGCGTATRAATVLGGGFGRGPHGGLRPHNRGGVLGTPGRRCLSSSAPARMSKSSLAAPVILLVAGLLAHTTACYVALTSSIRIEGKFDKLQAALDQFERDQTKA